MPVPARRPLQQPISNLQSAKSPRYENPHHIHRRLRSGPRSEFRPQDPKLQGHRAAEEDLPDRPQDPGTVAPKVCDFKNVLFMFKSLSRLIYGLLKKKTYELLP